MAKWTPSPNFLPGNTEMGSDLEDSHQLTGSVTISGSLAVNGVNITGGGGGGGGSPGGVGNSVQVNDGAGGFEGNSNLKYIPGGGGADALRLTGSVQMTGSIELSGAINQTGSINMYGWGFGPGNPADITIVPGHSPDGPWVPTAITIGNLAVGSPNPGDYSQVINYGSLSCSHGITASSFVGDGSGLTNLPGGGGGSPGGGGGDVQWNDGAGGFEGDTGLSYEPLYSGGDPGTLYFPTASTTDADHTIKAWDGSGGGSARNINVIMADDAGSNALFYKNSSGAQVALIDSLGNISGSTLYGDKVISQIVTASVFRVDGALGYDGGLYSTGMNPLYIGMDPSVTANSGFITISDSIEFYVSGSPSATTLTLQQGGGFEYRGTSEVEPPTFEMDSEGMFTVSNTSGTIEMDSDSGQFSVAVGDGGTGWLQVTNNSFVAEDGTGSFGLSGGTGSLNGKLTADLFYNSINDAGTINGSQALDGNQSNIFRILYDGATQLTMSTMTPGASYVLFLSNSVGAAAVTYDPATFKFPGGTVPTNTQVQGAYDIISGISDGVQFFCDMTKNFS